MTDGKQTLLGSIRDQLQQEMADDAKAVAAGLRHEFDGGTVDLEGQAATDYLQATWVQGKGLRASETDPTTGQVSYPEIERLGGQKWWDQYFQHVAPAATALEKKVFFTAIEAGIAYDQAILYSRVLAGNEPEHAPQQPMAPAQPAFPIAPPDQVPQAAPPPPPLPEMAPPMAAAPPPGGM